MIAVLLYEKYEPPGTATKQILGCAAPPGAKGRMRLLAGVSSEHSQRKADPKQATGAKH